MANDKHHQGNPKLRDHRFPYDGGATGEGAPSPDRELPAQEFESPGRRRGELVRNTGGGRQTWAIKRSIQIGEGKNLHLKNWFSRPIYQTSLNLVLLASRLFPRAIEVGPEKPSPRADISDCHRLGYWRDFAPRHLPAPAKLLMTRHWPRECGASPRPKTVRTNLLEEGRPGMGRFRSVSRRRFEGQFC